MPILCHIIKHTTEHIDVLSFASYFIDHKEEAALQDLSPCGKSTKRLKDSIANVYARFFPKISIIYVSQKKDNSECHHENYRTMAPVVLPNNL